MLCGDDIAHATTGVMLQHQNPWILLCCCELWIACNWLCGALITVAVQVQVVLCAAHEHAPCSPAGMIVEACDNCTQPAELKHIKQQHPLTSGLQQVPAE